MPRVSREQTGLNKIAIEDVSSRLFRERGIRSVSVADLMAEAGLTHGGFYGHFDSKDDLVAAACGKAFAHSADLWRELVATAGGGDAVRDAITSEYLSRENCDDPGTACPSAAMASDVAREDVSAPVKKVYLTGLKEQIDVLASLSPSGDRRADRKAALTQMALLVGTMVLARATSGDSLSNEFLDAARQQLLGEDASSVKREKKRLTKTPKL